jgi:hypothetical protein
MKGKTSPWAYPKDIYQDVLSERLMNAAQPAQSVMSDMLPVPYQAPVQNVKPSYPTSIVQDELGKRVYKPNFTMSGPQLALPAPQAKPSYPTQVIQDELAQRVSKPNFVMQGKQLALPAPASMMDEVAQSTAPLMDDVVKPMVQNVAKPAARVGMGTMLGAGLPGVADILLPNHAYASTGDEVKKMREEEFYKRYPSKPDAELMAMLGIPVPQSNMSEMDGGQMITPGTFQNTGRLPSPSQQQLPSGNGQEVDSEVPVQHSAKFSSSNSTSQSRPVGSPTMVNMNGNRLQLTNELMENDGDQYRQLVKQQQDAIGRKLAGRSELSYLDLSPAMAFVDNLTGSNLAKSYKGPSGPEGDMANMNALSKQLADFDNDKEKNRIALLNALKEKQDPMAMEMLRQGHRMELAMARNNLNQNAGLKPKDIVAVKEKFDKNDRVGNMDAALNFNQKLDAYLTELNKMGDSSYTMTGDDRANLERAYNDLLVNYNRDEAKLGALAGADINILQNVLKPVTGFSGMYNSMIGGGAQQARESIKKFQNLSKSKAQKELEAISQVYPLDIVGDQVDLYKNRINQMKGAQETPPPGKKSTLADELAKRGLGKKK